VLAGGPAGRAPLAATGPSVARHIAAGRAAELLDAFRASAAETAAVFGAVQEALAGATAAADAARAIADAERARAAEQAQALEMVTALVEPLQEALIRAHRRNAELAAALAGALASAETLRGRPTGAQATSATAPPVAPLSAAQRIMALGVPEPAVTAPASPAARDDVQPPPAPSCAGRDALRGADEAPARTDDTASPADSPAAAPATTPPGPHEPPPSVDETPARADDTGAPSGPPAAAPAETPPGPHAPPPPDEPRGNPQPPFAGVRVGEASNPGPDRSPWRAAFESREWAADAALPAVDPAARGGTQRPALAPQPARLSLAAQAVAVGGTPADDPARRSQSPWHAAYFGEAGPSSQVQSAARGIVAQTTLGGSGFGAPLPQVAASAPWAERASTVSPWASDPRTVRQRVSVLMPPGEANRSQASGTPALATLAAAAPEGAGLPDAHASASPARPPRPGDDIILAAVPLSTSTAQVGGCGGRPREARPRA
jgi:hypothetical protein